MSESRAKLQNEHREKELFLHRQRLVGLRPAARTPLTIDVPHVHPPWLAGWQTRFANASTAVVELNNKNLARPPRKCGRPNILLARDFRLTPPHTPLEDLGQGRERCPAETPRWLRWALACACPFPRKRAWPGRKASHSSSSSTQGIGQGRAAAAATNRTFLPFSALAVLVIRVAALLYLLRHFTKVFVKKTGVHVRFMAVQRGICEHDYVSFQVRFLIVTKEALRWMEQAHKPSRQCSCRFASIGWPVGTSHTPSWL